MTTRFIESYIFDVVLQCRDCQVLNGQRHDPNTGKGRAAAREHAEETGHKVEVIESVVRAYGKVATTEGDTK